MVDQECHSEDELLWQLHIFLGEFSLQRFIGRHGRIKIRWSPQNPDTCMHGMLETRTVGQFCWVWCCSIINVHVYRINVPTSSSLPPPHALNHSLNNFYLLLKRVMELPIKQSISHDFKKSCYMSILKRTYTPKWSIIMNNTCIDINGSVLKTLW